MTQSSLKDAAQALTTALSRRLDADEADSASSLAQRALQRRLLSVYAEELNGLDADGAAAWLLQRLATLEARQLLLQAEQYHAFGADDDEGPAPAAAPQSLPLATIIAEPAILPRSVTVYCDESVAHRGFYPVEHTPDGLAFRWIGPAPQVTIYVPRLRSCGEVKIYLHGAFVLEVLGDVKISLDGGSPAGVTLDREGELTVLVAQPIPGPPQDNAAMALIIDAVRSDSPSRHGADDHRDLSLAVLRVTLSDV